MESGLKTETVTVTTLRSEVVVLIAEDNKGHYLLAKNCLHSAGLENEIIWLEDGQAALDYLYKESTPRLMNKKFLLLLDIRMPKVDGIEVLERIKQNQDFNHIGVIMLTTSEDQQIAARCYELGCDAHIIKPPGEVLLKAIERVGERL